MGAIKTRLFTPGPVEIPPRILRALSQVPPHHRTDQFRDVMRRVSGELAWLHGTAGEVFLLAASGTGAMEAAVVNLMAPGERALVVDGGKFGQRWGAILAAFGIAREVLAVEWGRAVDPAEVEHRLASDPSLTTLFVTHSETSTGVLHDVRALAGITKRLGRRIVVDGVTSVGVHPLPQDEWGLDVVVCGSQKGLMLPPGIATVSLAPWAAAAIEGERLPRFYFDLRRARKSAPLGETAWTAPVSLVLALEESLAMIREEGLDAVHARHAKVAHAVRAGALASGYALFAQVPSHAVTALTPPAGVEAPAVVKRLRDVHGMVVAGGQDQLKGRILRVGHMGHYDRADAMAVVAALEECALALGGRGPGSPGFAGASAGAVGAARAAWDAA
ncbi:MAG TPA: alanine--glyoxylate aminotransferase family protein [Dongiaceae bacterium]|nr:alanine--glyoxylate aminotransferase family protein [Dongiaceae bacterium]